MNADLAVLLEHLYLHSVVDSPLCDPDKLSAWDYTLHHGLIRRVKVSFKFVQNGGYCDIPVMLRGAIEIDNDPSLVLYFQAWNRVHFHSSTLGHIIRMNHYRS